MVERVVVGARDVHECGSESDAPDDVALRLRTQTMMGPLRAAVRKAHALGVPIAASTDGSYAEDDIGDLRVAHDIALLREFGGLAPLESITAATLNGARVMGIESRTGTIRVGMEADLVAYDGDPLADATTLFEPRLVVAIEQLVRALDDAKAGGFNQLKAFFGEAPAFLDGDAQSCGGHDFAPSSRSSARR